MAEVGRPAEAAPVGDIIHGGLLVAALIEQVERGLCEPVTRGRLVHGASSSPLCPAAATCDPSLRLSIILPIFSLTDIRSHRWWLRCLLSLPCPSVVPSWRRRCPRC